MKACGTRSDGVKSNDAILAQFSVEGHNDCQTASIRGERGRNENILKDIERREVVGRDVQRKN